MSNTTALMAALAASKVPPATAAAGGDFKFPQPALDGFETLIGGLLEEAQKRLAVLQTQRAAVDEQIARIEASVKPINEALAFYRRRKGPPATRPTSSGQNQGQPSHTARLMALALETARRDGEVSTRGLAKQAVDAGLFPGLLDAEQFGSKVLSRLSTTGKLQRIDKGRYTPISTAPAAPAETG